MRKLFFTCLGLFCSIWISKAQAPSIGWIQNTGSASMSQLPSKTALDAAGNLYVASSFAAGTLDLDPGPGVTNVTGITSQNIALQVFDKDGNFLRGGAIVGTTGFALLGDFTVDAAGNMYLCANISDDVDFDPTSGVTVVSETTNQSVGCRDIVVAKISSTLNLEWAQVFGSFACDNSQGIALDAAGNVYTTGDVQQTADYDPSAGVANVGNGGNDPYIFIQKLDNNGNFQWVRGAGSTGFDGSYGVATDASGNVIIAGTYQLTAGDFDPGVGTANLTASGNYDVFVWKLDTNGDFVWVESTQGQASTGNQGRRVRVDAANNIYVSGIFSGTCDFDPDAGVDNESSVSTADADVFTWKLDENGNHQWVGAIGNNNAGDGISDLKVSASTGNVFTVGNFNSTVDFDPGVGTDNRTGTLGDGYIWELDTNGDLVNAYTFGSTSTDATRCIALGTDSEFYIGTQYTGTVDFDFGPGVNNQTQVSPSQGLLAKYAPSLISITEFINDVSGTEGDDEWVELYNHGTIDVNIRGWRISDEGSDDDEIVSTDFIIPPDAYVIIAGNKTNFETQWLGGCPNANVIEVPGLTMANGADEIIIEDNNGNIIWSVAYDSDATEGRATYYTETTYGTTVWGSSATPGIDRDDLDPASGTIGYQGNNHTADPLAYTSTMGDVGSPFNGDLTYTDIARGDALEFDGGDDYVDLTNSADFDFNGTDNFTLEAWFKTADASSSRILSKFNGTPGYQITSNAGDVTFQIRTSSANTTITSGIGSLNDDTWHHVAAVSVAGNIELFVDGISQGTAVSTGDPSNSSSLIMGAFDGTSAFFNGAIDEVRVWDVARTATEIRENMHLTLDGCETGLQAYYQFNDGTNSTTLADATGNNDGTLTNMDASTDWVASGVNVGDDNDDNSNSQTITSISGTGAQSFAAANLDINYTALSGTRDVTVTYQEFRPNVADGATGNNIIQNPMWTVNNSSNATTQAMTMTFTSPGLSTTNNCNIKLYNRTMNADDNWSLIATATSATATTATFEGVAVTGQFMIVEDASTAPDLTRGDALEFDGTDDYVRISHNASQVGMTQLTLETWVYLDPAGAGTFRNILMKGDYGYGMMVDGSNQLAYWSEANYTNCPRFGTVPTGTWTHLAVVVEQGVSTTMYINGVNVGSTTTVAQTAINNGLNQDLLLGTQGTNCVCNFMNGDMDELRIWNTARTADEIRENMHLTSDGCETGLVSYYQFNDGVNSPTLMDKVGGNDGTLTNMDATTDWITSTVNIGDDFDQNSNSQTITSISGTGTQNFTNANLDINYTAVSGARDVTVTYQEFDPNDIAGPTGTNIIQNPMWTVNQSSAAATQTMKMTFTSSGLTTANPCEIQLFNRPMNDDGAWVFIGTATSASATTATFEGVTTTGQFMLVEDTNNSTDIVRGTALDFDGVDDYVELSYDRSLLTDYTITAWFRYDGSIADNYQPIIANTAQDFFIGKDAATSNIGVQDGNYASAFATGTDAWDGNWHHIAVVRNAGTNILFLDGVQLNALGFSGASAGLLRIGNEPELGGYYFNGLVDEVQIWNTVRTATEIRENMHLTLNGCESGLQAYYQFNDGTGSSTLVDAVIGNDGTLMNMDVNADWVASGVNTGKDVLATSNSVTNTSVGTGVSNFAVANLSIDFTAHSATEDITVTYQAFNPNATSGVNGNNIIQNPMWTVNKATNTTTQTMNMTFTFASGTLTTTNPCEVALYTRTMGADGDWTLVGKSTAVTATTATFEAVTTTGQFMVVESTIGFADITRGDVLAFDGGNDHVVVGDISALNFERTDAFSMEAWIQTTATNYNFIMSKQNDIGLNYSGYGLFTFNGELSFQLVNSYPGNTLWVSTADIGINDGEWHHVVGTYDGSSDESGVTLYVDGVEIPHNIKENTLSGTTLTSATFNIASRVTTSLAFEGSIDEVRVWSTERTATEIRENMHLTSTGCETSLVSYYQLNDGTGSSTVTDVASGNTGTLTNMDASTDWLASDVNTGNDATPVSNSETQTVAAGVSTMNFATANLQMEFENHSVSEDFTVTYQAYTPNTTNGATGVTIFNNPVWTVNKATNTSTHKFDLTFTNGSAPFTADASKYRLYWRTMNSAANWTSVSADAEIISASQIKFTGLYETGQFMIVQTSDADITDVRGNMYEFDGVDGFISVPDDASLDFAANNFTIEYWTKKNASSAGFSNIGGVNKWNTGGSAGTNEFLLCLTTSGNDDIPQFSIESGITSYVCGATTSLTLGEWTHIVGVREGTDLKIYINGVLENTVSIGNVAVNNVGRDLMFNAIEVRADGLTEMDEVRIWNVARTEDEIRSMMHLTLRGDETGLVSYYQFNTDDAAGTAGGVKDAFGGNDGTTANMATTDYIPSEVAVAGGVSQMIDVLAAGPADFDEPEVAINFGASNPDGNVWVYRLETEKPHGWDMTPGGFDFDNEYFVIQNFGNNATFDILSDMTFGRLNYIDPTVTPSDIEVYKRESNGFGDWTGMSQGGANAIQGGSAGACAYNTSNGINSFSQFVLVNKSISNTDLPIELLEFKAARENAEQVRLNWATATEVDNVGFEIERMLDDESEFEVVGFVEGYGNSTQQINYSMVDDNAHRGISYYRLKQMDMDGNYTHSEVRAVAGDDTNFDFSVNVYPNPTAKGLNVDFSRVSTSVKSANVRILDIHGRVVYDAVVGVAQDEILAVDEVEDFASGVYFVHIMMDNGSTSIHKIIRK